MSRHVETGDVWVVWKPWMEVQYNRACMVWSCTPKVLPLLQSLSNPHEVSSGKILFFTLPNKHSENPMRNHSERCRTAQCFATQAAVLSFQHKASFLSHLDLFFFPWSCLSGFLWAPEKSTSLWLSFVFRNHNPVLRISVSSVQAFFPEVNMNKQTQSLLGSLLWLPFFLSLMLFSVIGVLNDLGNLVNYLHFYCHLK